MKNLQKITLVASSFMLLGFTAVGTTYSAQDNNIERNLERESRMMVEPTVGKFIKISKDDPQASIPTSLLDKLEEPQEL